MLGHESNLLLGVKQLALFGAILGLVFSTGAISYQAAFADDDDDDHDYKVYVCHKDKDLKISIYALKKHLKHKDSEGKCKKDDDKHDDDKHDDDKKFKKHKVLTGEGPPPKKLGKKGDLYFDSFDDDSLEYYVKVAKKKWELRGTLVEPSNDCERGDVLKYNKVENKWVCLDDLVEDDDADPENELQKLSLTGQDLSLTPPGNTENLPFVFDDFACPSGEAVIGYNNDGTTNCAPAGGSGANKQLSNLDAGNVAVNTDVIPDTDITHDLGSATFQWLIGYFESLKISNSIDVNGNVDVGQNLDVGDSLDVSQNADVGGTFDVVGVTTLGDLFFNFFGGENCLDTSGCFPGSYLDETSVDNSRIVDNTLGAGQIGTDAITTDELADDAVETSNIKNAQVTTAKLAPGAVSLNVVRDSSSDTIAAGDEVEITFSCATSTASITGFTALEITELGSMVLAEMTDDGSSSDTATVKVVNINEDDSIQVEIVFYCAEISP